MVRNNRLFLLLLLLITLPLTLFSENFDVININKNSNSIDLYEHIEILEDTTNSLTIDDIVNKNYTQTFKSTSKVGNSFGFNQSSFWVKFQVKMDENIHDSYYVEIDFPQLDYVTLYYLDKNSKIVKKESGEFVAKELKDVYYRKYLFRLSYETQKVKTYYINIRTAGSVQIPVKIISSSFLVESIDIGNFILGGYYGNMFLLMIAAFVAFYKIRDYMFLTYGIYILSYLIFQLSINGFLSQMILFFPFGYSNNVPAFAVSFVVFGGALFAGSFLQIWGEKHQKIKLLYYLLIISAFLGMLIAFFIDFSLGTQISAIAGVSLPPIVLFSAIYVLYHGYKPAKYFLAAWSIFLLGVFASGLLFLGFLPYTFLTAYSMQIGSTFELILISYALIYRLDNLVKEKNLATQHAQEYLQQINEGLESLVEERTIELEDKNALLKDMVNRDGMTNLLNHRSSLEKLEVMTHTAKRYNYRLSIVMLDIDLFKSINDTYGHQAGDKVIISIADILKSNIRMADTAGRYGGEEFILLLHDITLDAAIELTQRVRQEVASLHIPEIQNSKITISAGISQYHPLETSNEVISRADKALYKAKELGRNRVISEEEPTV